MTIDPLLLEKSLCERLCATVTVHERTDGTIMIDAPFRFPDGDNYPIYLSGTHYGKVVLSDRGHTMMHISYENDVDALYEGQRSALRERIVKESGIDEDKGIFSIETTPDKIADSLFTLGQALTRIYDLTFLNRDRVNSTFYEDFKSLLFTIVDEGDTERDYIPTTVPDGANYPVDYRIEGKGGMPIFLYGVPNKDKARLTTIMLSHFLLNRLQFNSIVVFRNQQEIPPFDLARLTNVSDMAIASLEAERDFRRKIERIAA